MNTTANTQASVWYMYILALVFLFTCVVGVLGYTLCFEATSMGGWLPFVLITAGPMGGWLAANVARA